MRRTQIRATRASRAHGRDAWVVELVRAIALCRPSWNARAIEDMARKRAHARGTPGPSIDQVRAITAKIPAALRQVAAGNMAAFNNSSLLTYPLAHPAEHIVFQIDHREPVPVLVRDERPPPPRAPTGQARP